MEKSRRLSAVPVFVAAGRRESLGPLRSASVCAQKAFCFGSVFPARMFVVRNAACGETAATPLTYLVVNYLKRHEGIDVYDRDTRFTPFALTE